MVVAKLFVGNLGSGGSSFCTVGEFGNSLVLLIVLASPALLTIVNSALVGVLLNARVQATAALL